MSITGLCQVCATEPAERQCQRCGTLVCEDHYDRERTVCVECASGNVPGPDDPTDEGERFQM